MPRRYPEDGVESDLFRHTHPLRIVQGENYIAPEYELQAEEAERIVRARLEETGRGDYITSTQQTGSICTVLVSAPG